MSTPTPESIPRIVFLITEDWYFWTHRLPLARAMRDAGFDVIVATRIHDHGQRISDEGFRAVPIRLRRKGRNPFGELYALADLVRLYRRERPVLVHHVALKPVLYGSLAASIASVPAVVNAIAGLGHAFAVTGFKARTLKALSRLAYRSAFARSSSRAIFQTEADRCELVSLGIVPPERAVLIRGAGVDVQVFHPVPEPLGVPIIMFAGRLLWNKGVGELVEAGILLARQQQRCRIVLVGTPDFDNPMAISEEQLGEWERDGRAEWWQHHDDMPTVLQQAAIVAHPTFYGEGVPKILLEAAACGRPIVTSNLPGCRDVVQDGESGFIVPSRQPEALAIAIGRLLDDAQLRARMGECGRARVVREFAEEAVVAQTMDVYRSALAQSDRGRQAARML